jgi:glucose-1-phosphate cytidylyltransferase
MKVVLFCGGFGTRLRAHSDIVPKPLVPVGDRPILWHLMKYYAHFGHKEFILCLGYQADLVKQYFLNYDECLSNDFVLSRGGRDIRLLHRDIDDWKITFADTGLHSNIAERLKAVEHYLDGDEMFLANYSDGVSDLDLAQYIEHFERQRAIASFLSVRSNYTFHIVSFGADGSVADVQDMKKSDVWINAGFFIFRREIFDYIHPGDELADETFQRLIGKQALVSHRHHGFWAAMDTLKDKTVLDNMAARGQTPWTVWRNAGSPRLATPPR